MLDFSFIFLVVYGPTIGFILGTLYVLSKKIYKNHYWVTGFSIGVGLSFLIIISGGLLPRLIPGLIFFSYLLGFVFLSFAHAIKKRKELKWKVLFYILAGVVLILIIWFGFIFFVFFGTPGA